MNKRGGQRSFLIETQARVLGLQAYRGIDELNSSVDPLLTTSLDVLAVLQSLSFLGAS
jgi:hypothetical protein